MSKRNWLIYFLLCLLVFRHF